MTFEEYLKDLGYKYIDAPSKQMEEAIIKLAEHWHTQELKSMRAKGANTTNSKYSKEERSEWAKKGGRPRKPVDNSLTK